MSVPDDSFAARLTDWTTRHDTKARARITRQAKAEITRRFDEIATDHGYAKTSGGWTKHHRLLRLGFGLQPARHGFMCFINLNAIPRWWVSHLIGVSLSEHLRLGRFYDAGPARGGERGALLYGDVRDLPQELTHACAVLDQRALPFLDTLRGRSRPDVASFLATCPPLPVPR